MWFVVNCLTNAKSAVWSHDKWPVDLTSCTSYIQNMMGFWYCGFLTCLQAPHCEPPTPSKAPLSFTHIWVHHQPVGLGHWRYGGGGWGGYIGGRGGGRWRDRCRGGQDALPPHPPPHTPPPSPDASAKVAATRAWTDACVQHGRPGELGDRLHDQRMGVGFWRG